VKRYLERLGFTVKGEVCGCDLVALRGNEPPIVVIGELKLAFSLELVEANSFLLRLRDRPSRRMTLDGD
jgi:hypothetical protein